MWQRCLMRDNLASPRRLWAHTPFLLGCVACGAPSPSAPVPSTGASATTTGVGSTAATHDDSHSADGTTSAGPGWVEESEIDGSWGAFYSVWGPTPDDLWVAGGRVHDDGSSEGVLVHREQTTWTRVELDPQVPVLSWVGPAGDDVWVVGASGTCLRREGNSWAAHPTGETRRLWGVWGAAEDDAWAVGGNGIADLPLLLHFDGVEWSNHPLAPLDSNALFKVWGRARDDVWIVGDGGVVLHYDGDAWAPVEHESITDLIGVHGAGDVVIAVGGRANGRVVQLSVDGVDGETLTVPGLAGIWVDATGRATIAGDLGTVGTIPSVGAPIELEAPSTTLLLHAVHGFDGGPRWAVGGDLVYATPSFGIVLRNDGT